MATRGARALVAAMALRALVPAGAQVTADQPASLVIFPKIIADGTRDTVIQLSSTSNAPVAARCWYEGSLLVFGQPMPTTIFFDIALTQQQPTMWVASLGRPADPSEPPCSSQAPNYDCYGAGLDPGAVLPLPIGFAGMLRCVETDLSGAPLSGNHLTGQATLEDVSSGDVAKYNALGLGGSEANDGDRTLRLGDEYAGCPQALVADHGADGGEVAALGPGSATAVEITVVPCTADVDDDVPTSVTVLFTVSNEFEQRFSAAAVVSSWGNLRLRDVSPVFDATVLGTGTAQTRLRPSPASASGILALLEERRMAAPGGAAACAAGNVYVEGIRAASDLITLP